MCSTRSRTVSIPSEARRSAIFGPTPDRDSTRRSSTSTLLGFGAPWSMPAKPASAGRKLTERARTPRAYAPVRTSTRARGEGDADPAEPDLVRARVIDDVVRLPRSVGEVDEAVVPREKRVRDTGAGGPRDDASSPDFGVLVPERDRSRSFEDDEELLLRCMAVRRISLAARRDGHVAEAGVDRPDHVTEVEVYRAGVELPPDSLFDVGDPAGTRRDLADLGLADRSLAFPGMRAADVHPARVHPGDAGARQH